MAPLSQLDRNSSVPLFKQLYGHYKQAILDGELAEGDRLPSIRHLQRRLTVGHESIKRAMADLERDGFVSRIQGKGTFVAKRRPARRFWGVVVPFYAEYFNKVILEFQRLARERGVALEHVCDYDDSRRQVELVADFAWRRAEAAIVVPTRDEALTLGHFQRISRRMPVVLFDRSSLASQLPYVIQDYAFGVRQAFEALAAAGARRVGCVRDPLWAAGNPVFQTIEEAYREACDRHAGGYTRFWDAPAALAEEDLASPDFDALICVNDQVACLAVGVLRERGIDVPGQVQVIGYNDSELGRFFTPRVTTVGPDLPRMAEQVQDIIFRQASGEPVELQQYVNLPRLIRRETTK